ncbi:cytochrome c biogenesis protein ResB [Herbiconiux sp. SYSU D00978]|uniref:cytochrome c biogenesis protein ResB n=1 Tax=Herbiconiux sp. SYSU D00978 TaxID=2812562 RepID=UPI001F6041EA|nr:cytochrome c biogenesis protein ResB [Herbiconiux sp. SYSU D00978]
MSRSSDTVTDPLRPDDYVGSAAPTVNQPKLGPLGYLRFFWRQLTSMRTALFLLLLLAIAAIPGSLVPQRSADPNGVQTYYDNDVELARVLDFFQLFDVYGSVWFSAVYLLLFISLIGCVLPRTKHHFQALRSRPPKTPARLQRLEGFRTQELGGTDVAGAVASADQVLRRAGYRTERYGDSVSAERGYLRETGNLVFHSALVGVLICVGLGGGLGYTGQKIIVEGQSFTNTLLAYDSFNPGRWFGEETLNPYRIELDSLDVEYEEQNLNAYGQPLDFTANVRVYDQGAPEGVDSTIKVNEPLREGGNDIYLLGNGFAPTITVRNADGDVVFREAVPFLPQDAQLTSIGVVKVPDGLSEQLGMIGFFYPTASELETGALASTHPDLRNPVLTLQLYTGDLQLDDGIPRSVYALETDDMTQLTGRGTDIESLVLAEGDTVEMPNGLGTVTFEQVDRYVSLDIHRDPTQGWVLIFAVLAVAGLLTSLFIPRRRVWIKATEGPDGGVRLEYAGLARGEDPGLERAVADVAERHRKALEKPGA